MGLVESNLRTAERCATTHSVRGMFSKDECGMVTILASLTAARKEGRGPRENKHLGEAKIA